MYNELDQYFIQILIDVKLKLDMFSMQEVLGIIDMGIFVLFRFNYVL